MALQKIRLGKFAQDSSGGLYGRISGLGIGSTTVVSQEAVSHEGRSYLKLVAESGNASYEVGVAFPKEKDGMVYYSVSIDSPLFAMPLNAALFPDKNNEGMFDLIWNRPEIPYLAVDANLNAAQLQGRRFIGSGATP